MAISMRTRWPTSWPRTSRRSCQCLGWQPYAHSQCPMCREFGGMVPGNGAEHGITSQRIDEDRYTAAARRIDTTVAHPARRYNYWLGGKDHFAADRESGDAVLAAFPTARVAALENRAFMGRTVEYLAGEVGVRQFLDIGTGIPAPNNTHEVAQRVAPASRVIYVDNGPIVLAHARALLT